jgi:hypothetical protein
MSLSLSVVIEVFSVAIARKLLNLERKSPHVEVKAFLQKQLVRYARFAIAKR